MVSSFYSNSVFLGIFPTATVACLLKISIKLEFKTLSIKRFGNQMGANLTIFPLFSPFISFFLIFLPICRPGRSHPNESKSLGVLDKIETSRNEKKNNIFSLLLMFESIIPQLSSFGFYIKLLRILVLGGMPISIQANFYCRDLRILLLFLEYLVS